MSNRNELHEERLATTDEHGHRVYLFPEDVKGFWRSLRTKFYWFLIGIYLILPWIHYEGKQIILLNIPDREFTFFGTTFYAHDAPLLLLIFLLFVFSIGFITSLWGRVWCGWACPQTVFIDSIYLKIERLVEGKPRQRKKLQEMPWNGEKTLKKGIKWLLFLLVSLHISHSFLGYFVGARRLFWISMSPPTEHMTLFLIMLFLTALFLFDFGWFREQFCIIACPYGRFQSVIMDENSLVVAYDPNRGEPRRGQVPRDQEGDCINCFHCVKACPTGIDIRRGTQLECIACTNCIDACDEIMVKVGKPKGLIRYESEASLEGREPKRINIRSSIYLLSALATVAILVFNVVKSSDLKATLIRGARTPYKEQTLENGKTEILNLYKLRLDYKGEKTVPLTFRVADEKIREKIDIITPLEPFPLKGGRSQTAILHFRFSPTILKNGRAKIMLDIVNKRDEVLLTKEVKLVGPLD